jgi:hypothetical protein
MTIQTHNKLLVTLAFVAAMAALLLVNGDAGAQDRTKGQTAQQSSFTPVVDYRLADCSAAPNFL